MAEEESVAMSSKPRPIDDSKPLRIRRGRVESVDLYEITDNELDALEKGTPAELQLNFAVFLLSVAFAAISSLLTASFPSKTIETIFIVISVSGILIGAYLLIAWSRTLSAVKDLCQRIRERIPPEAMASPESDSDSEFPAVEDPDGAPPSKG